MNNKFISLATAAALLSLGFTACNKDDAPKPNVITPDKTTAYAKVSISMGVTTRAGEVFDAGTADEAKVGKISLALYDQYGTYVGSGELENDGEIQGNKENVSDTYANKIFKLKLFEGANEPTQVIAFINTVLDNSRLEVLTEEGVELAAEKLFDGESPTKGTSFAMTNSGYFDENNNYVVAAKLGNIFKTKELAEKGGEDGEVDKEDVTTIYVERLAAKVKVDVSDDLKNEPDYKIIDVTGETVTLKFEPKKWAATGTAENEWLVKTKYTTHTDWKGDFRTFWAESFAYSYGYNDYYTTDGQVAEKNPLNYVTLQDMNPMNVGSKHLEFNENGVMYVPEHTTGLQPNEDPKNIIANTYALIVGDYKVEGKNSEWFKADDAFDFYLLLSDMTDDGKKVYTIYNKSQLIGLLLHYNGLDVVYTEEKEENPIITYPGAEGYTGELDLDGSLDIVYNKAAGKYELAELADATGSLYYAVVKDGETTYVEIMGEGDEKKYENSTNSRHYYYQDGYAFFNAPIPHDYTLGDDGNVENVVYGVVRNHSYIMTINKIESLGAPLNNDQYGPEGDDPDGPYPPIIPDPDDLTDHFINASIKVLSWHEKSSGIVL